MDLVQLQSEVHDVYTFDAFQAAVFNEYKDLREGHLGNLSHCCLQDEARP